MGCNKSWTAGNARTVLWGANKSWIACIASSSPQDACAQALQVPQDAGSKEQLGSADLVQHRVDAEVAQKLLSHAQGARVTQPRLLTWQNMSSLKSHTVSTRGQVPRGHGFQDLFS